MRCPECQNQFDRSGSGNRTVHHCRTCGKAWLPFAALRALVRDAVNTAGIAKKVIGFTETEPQPSDVNCPACVSTAMHQIELRGVPVVRCETCLGVLLERGQFLSIVRRVVDAEQGYAIAEAEWSEIYLKVRLEALRYRQDPSSGSLFTSLIDT